VTVVPDNACGVPQTQGDLGALAAIGSAQTQGGTANLVYALVGGTPGTADAATPDAIYVELWDNYGVFAGRHASPGHLRDRRAELDYATCGVCVFTLADVAMGQATRILEANRRHDQRSTRSAPRWTHRSPSRSTTSRSTR